MTDIDDELRERVRRQYGDGSDLPRTALEAAAQKKIAAKKSGNGRTAAANSEAAKKRRATGSQFEAELDDTHAGMLSRGEGYIMPHYPPTVHVGRSLVYRKGGGPCDYSGHVNYWHDRDEVRPERASGGMPSLHRPRRIPVVFDAKVLNAKDATYHHDPKQIAQLVHMRNAVTAGACAFLLVRADAIERVFLIAFAAHGEALIRGEGVELYERERAGSRTQIRLGRAVSAPAFKTTTLLPSVAYTPGRGWLWAALLKDVLT